MLGLSHASLACVWESDQQNSCPLFLCTAGPHNAAIVATGLLALRNETAAPSMPLEAAALEKEITRQWPVFHVNVKDLIKQYHDACPHNVFIMLPLRGGV